jgi:predicted phage tail protein
MITIYLQGELADYFTPQITVAVSSVAEAIAALKANFKDFANYLFEAASFGVNYQEIGEEHLKCPISKKVQSIRITPIIAGAGAAGRIIAGVTLIGLAVAASFGVVGLLGIAPLTVGLTGGALLFQGISALFSRQDSPSGDDKKSLVFGGTSTTVKEGGRVPIIYGVALVGIYVISAKITTSYVSGGSGGGGGGGGGK